MWPFDVHTEPPMAASIHPQNVPCKSNVLLLSRSHPWKLSQIWEQVLRVHISAGSHKVRSGCCHVLGLQVPDESPPEKGEAGGLALPKLTLLISPGDANTPSLITWGLGKPPPRSILNVPRRLRAGTSIDVMLGDAPDGFGNVKEQEMWGSTGLPIACEGIQVSGPSCPS